MAKASTTGKSSGQTNSASRPRSAKAAPLTGRAAKKEARAAKKAAKGQGKIKTIIQGYKMTKKRDPKLPWVMLLVFIITVTVVLVPSILFLNVWVMLPFAIMLGVLVALIVFGRRAQKAAFGQVEGQPGAAAWVLEGMRGQWEVEAGIAGTTSLDAVHRVLGRPGFLLVGEGVPHRVKSLLAQEKKKLARVAGDVPIYDIVIGDSEGQVPLNKLSTHVMKLPRNITAAEVNTMKRKLSALGGSGGSSQNKMPIPQGPLPKGSAMTISQRAIRRRGG